MLHRLKDDLISNMHSPETKKPHHILEVQPNPIFKNLNHIVLEPISPYSDTQTN
ncbi:hypothetical protein Fmac_007389 [Flemingia macrophylla]|uniref:Uncharacterized protein n=1 Tax=Flemingia macrophylla TaxID=520843 RepID=A0ABD1MUG8_9FABA